MDRLAQGVTNRAHGCTETEDQRIQDSHSQPYARFSTGFLRRADEYRSVASRTRRPQPAAAVPPRWRWSEQLSRPRGCICAAGSFHLAAVVSFRFAHQPAPKCVASSGSHFDEQPSITPSGGTTHSSANLLLQRRCREAAPPELIC